MLKITHIPMVSAQLADIELPLYVTHYIDDNIPPTATVIYLHGGGLLAGSRQDLPLLHQQLFTQAGIQILAVDYPLSPQFQVEQILTSLLQSLKFLKNLPLFFGDLPYFLWGRSAGAYLALLLGRKLPQMVDLPQPTGIISYYGYGFLTDNWFEQVSSHYKQLPQVDDESFQALTDSAAAERPIQAFAAYIYARQTGCWKSLIYQGRDKFFYLDYSLRLADLNLPLFLAHSTADPDVPFAEFQALRQKYVAQCFVASSDVHDFDRDEQSALTQELLQATLDFIRKYQ